MRQPAKRKKATKRSVRTNGPSKRPKPGISRSLRGIHASKNPTAKTSTSHVTRSKAARANISEGLRLYVVAGRPTRSQVIKVYGARGPMMTWAQRAKAGVDAKHLHLYSDERRPARGGSLMETFS